MYQLHFSFIIGQIHHSAIYATLLPFAVLNYDPPSADELFDVCIQRLTPHISKSIVSFHIFLMYFLKVTLTPFCLCICRIL